MRVWDFSQAVLPGAPNPSNARWDLLHLIRVLCSTCHWRDDQVYFSVCRLFLEYLREGASVPSSGISDTLAACGSSSLSYIAIAISRLTVRNSFKFSAKLAVSCSLRDCHRRWCDRGTIAFQSRLTLAFVGDVSSLSNPTSSREETVKLISSHLISLNINWWLKLSIAQNKSGNCYIRLKKQEFFFFWEDYRNLWTRLYGIRSKKNFFRTHIRNKFRVAKERFCSQLNRK